MSTSTDSTRLVTIVLLIIGLLILLPVFFMGFGMIGFGPMMGGMWGGGMMGDGPSGWLLISGLVMQLLFLAAILGGGYLLYRAVADSDPDTDPAIEELRRAYARGEMTDEEFATRRNTLDRTSDEE
ncbi:putative membrane protein [Halopenitus malekzadehii]|uniref:Putative membrane protein n=1 Tax=Halopenitus malekzadehii TaxID=1267564 RepID=A0A1H6JN12_9EURY|nr:SHOCT domain-containing protein [Halopenitus malekzadehii]SEH63791.1 putative membrane protein [Halopenitus malekzadehii]